jgi:Smg protein
LAHRSNVLSLQSGYSEIMFDVLVYLYEHYGRPEAFPEAEMLNRKLLAIGFDTGEISDALVWLEGLEALTRDALVPPSSGSSRVYAAAELTGLDAAALDFLQFMVSAGGLTDTLREVVLDRVWALPGGPVGLDDFKVLVLMVFWSMGTEPDALMLDELFVNDADRVIH